MHLLAQEEEEGEERREERGEKIVSGDEVLIVDESSEGSKGKESEEEEMEEREGRRMGDLVQKAVLPFELGVLDSLLETIIADKKAQLNRLEKGIESFFHVTRAHPAALLSLETQVSLTFTRLPTLSISKHRNHFVCCGQILSHSRPA